MVKGFKIMNLIFYTSWSTKAWIYLPLTQTNLFSFASIDGSRCQGSNEGLNLFAVSISQKKLAAGAMDMSVRTEDAAQALDTRLRLPWEFSYRRDELWQAVTGSHYNIVTLVSHYQAQCPALLVSVMFCHYFPVICRKRLMLKGFGTRVDTVTRMNGRKMTGLNRFVVISTIACVSPINFMMTC